MRFASRPFWIACGVLVCVACGNGGARVAVSADGEEPRGVEDASAPQPESADGGADPADADAGAALPPQKPPPVDPLLVKMALQKTAEAGPSSAGVRFEVVEAGPQNFWALAVVNRGTRAVRVNLDARTLSLELEHPANPKKKWLKPKRTTCRLPENMIPDQRDPAYSVELAPGEGVVEAFDPRFYCVPSKDGQSLLPGIKVTARLGWQPKKPKTVWRKGKRVEEPVPQVDPFVIEWPDAPVEGGSEAGAEKLEPAAVEAADDAERKQLVASSFELNTQYAPPAREPEEEQPLELRMSRGSDAQDERYVTTTVTLRNRSKKALKVFFRRELVTFEVMGPSGLVTCDPEPDQRNPSRLAFRTIAAGGQLSATSRLVELCPQATFASPGLYLIHGRFNARESGSEFGLSAFTGSVESEEPAVVRVRKGEQPFRAGRAQSRVQVGEQVP